MARLPRSRIYTKGVCLIATGLFLLGSMQLAAQELPSLARISHRIPAASADSTAIAAQIAQAGDCSMSIQLHRRLTDLNHTDSTLHALATKSCEKSRLALVASGDNQSLEAMVALVEAELSKNDKLVILDRREINRILREHELSAANLVEPDKAVKAGQLLRADAILLVNTLSPAGTPSKADGLVHIKLMETEHGLRLLDQFAEGKDGGIEASAKSLVKEILPTIEKLALPAENVVPIGIMDIGGAGLAEHDQWIRHAFAAMLSARLSKNPQILVLERSDMAILRKELALTDGDGDFWNSALLINGYLQGRGNKGIKAHLKFNSLNDAKFSEIRYLFQPDNLQTAVDEIADSICRDILEKPLSHAWDPESEALAFFRRGKALSNQALPLQAAPLFEVAHCLQPENLLYLRQMAIQGYRMLVMKGNRLCREGTGIRYYSDLELAHLFSKALKMYYDRYSDKSLPANEFYTDRLIWEGLNYLNSRYASSSEEVSSANDHTRALLRSIVENLEPEWDSPKNSRYFTRMPRLIPVVSVDLEDSFDQYDDLIRRFIMSPKYGGLIRSASERYRFWYRAFGIACRNWNHEAMQEHKGEYLLEKSESNDPLVAFMANKTLGKKRKALEVFSQHLRPEINPHNDNLKRNLCHNVKGLLRGISKTNETAWIEELEAFYQPLVQQEDVRNLSHWHPGAYSGGFHTHQKRIQLAWRKPYKTKFQSCDIALRYLNLLENILQVFSDNTEYKYPRLKVLQDQIMILKQNYCEETVSNMVEVKMLMENIYHTGAFGPFLIRNLEIRGNTLWIAFPNFHKRAMIVQVDLKKQELKSVRKIKAGIDSIPMIMRISPDGKRMYISSGGGGVTEIDIEKLNKDETATPARRITMSDGLPSNEIEGIAPIGKKLWLAYELDSDGEVGLGIYDLENRSWTPVACSKYEKGPIESPRCIIRQMFLANPKKIWFDLIGSHDSGIWELNTDNHQMRRKFKHSPVPLYPCLKMPVRHRNRIVLNGLACRIEYDTQNDETFLIIGHGKRYDRAQRFGWKIKPFIPLKSMLNGELGDLHSSAIYDDRLWTRLGKTRILIVKRGQCLEDATIIPNNILNGKPVLIFYSTPHGLLGIGSHSFGFIKYSDSQ